jgi:hypothetical protein
MSKYLIFACTLFLIGAGCIGTPQDSQVDYEVDVKPLIEEIDEKYQVRGSCNVIASKSTCIDYVGSIWDQPDQKELNCNGVGEYSKNTCPYSDLGGCQAGGGTMMETIAWSYDYGGQPISKEDAQYQAMACNTLPVGKWVHPDDFLK